MPTSRKTKAEAVLPTQDEVWLLGQPPLRDYLNFIKDSVVDGANANPAALVDEWRTANDYYHELEQREAGAADEAECLALDPAMAALAEEVTAHPHYRHTFDSLPTSFGLVELDRLIVGQKVVTWSFVQMLKSRLGPHPDPEALFRFCFPLESPDAFVRVQRVGSRRYVFRSNSADFRFHGSVLLRPEQIRDHRAFGPVAGVVGLVVGFGSNFLNIIRADKRLLLHNGYHRACALRDLGVTHAPCLIQTVTRQDELEITAKAAVAENPAFYFQTARPPLLKDFFDPRIRKVLVTHKLERMIEINFEIKETLLPE